MEKKPEVHNEKNKESLTNIAALTGYQHVEECKLINIYHPALNSSSTDQRAQHNTRQTVLIGTGDKLLKGTAIAQDASTTISKWDRMKLRSFWKSKDTVNRKNGSIQNRKKFLATPHSKDH